MRAITNPVPVILDTDIGTDIDDTWALAMLLRCPELDLKLVTTCTGDVSYRAKLAARFLELSGYTGVDVGIGRFTPLPPAHITQGPWVLGYSLKDYPGKVHTDGVGALVETIMNSPETVTLIGIGPLTNIADALEREPRIAERARFVGMHGSIAWSHETGKVIAEYNVKRDIAACQKVFSAPWEKTISPLDTCGRIRLTGPKYNAVVTSRDPLSGLVIENYAVWKKNGGWDWHADQSSVLFDCVAVHLACSNAWLRMKRIGIRVTGEGITEVNPNAPQVNCAMEWTDMGAFEDRIVERLTING